MICDRRTDSIETEVQIITQLPGISADGARHYINQGGSELVVFTPRGTPRILVCAGKYSFRSFLILRTRPAFFAVRISLGPGGRCCTPSVRPQSRGRRSPARFGTRCFQRNFVPGDLPIDDAFLDKVVNQIDQADLATC
jgi:hypothetical protein